MYLSKFLNIPLTEPCDQYKFRFVCCLQVFSIVDKSRRIQIKTSPVPPLDFDYLRLSIPVFSMRTLWIYG